MIYLLPRIWIHAIWSTKERMPLLDPSIERSVHFYLSNKFEEAGCTVRIINGMADHVHCLYQQNPLKSVSDVIKHVKGGSSCWINNQGMVKGKFAWQKGYAVYSVGSSGLEWVQHYIAEQKTHHRKKSYREEYNHFMRMHGWDEEPVG